ncbi:alpha/beta-hydrolase [Karstenula rhodostoma CBS 690.94]|uniref:Alpha/beta-hydrolase n=1 Tax=Karstenula rhodostoma CBS 690.94 TaxID=1392251 RepID=A0A9P4PH13_9PLEO|nr:alpha/beta-hydrolase [Karstenula rhodostoma CBS 690.94]
MATPPPPAEDHPRFTPFLRLPDIPYWSVRSEPVNMDMWIPRNIRANSHPPVLVNWHGGGLMSGVRDRDEWWQQYMLDLAVQHNALVLAPDYPLAPESKTPEMLASIERFLAWLLDEHAVSAPLRLTADTAKLLVMGGSAGGWCALWAGIKRPEAICTLLLQYPMVDIADEHYGKSQVRTPTTGWFEMLKALPESIVDEYLAKMQPGAVRVTEPGTGQTFPLTGAAFVHGRVAELVGQDCEETYPFRALEKGGVRLPGRIWVAHGQDDYVVPVRGSERLVELVEKNASATKIVLDTASGDHGFDVDMDRSSTALPIDERLRWVEEAWLA